MVWLRVWDYLVKCDQNTNAGRGSATHLSVLHTPLARRAARNLPVIGRLARRAARNFPVIPKKCP